VTVAKDEKGEVKIKAMTEKELKDLIDKSGIVQPEKPT